MNLLEEIYGVSVQIWTMDQAMNDGTKMYRRMEYWQGEADLNKLIDKTNGDDPHIVYDEDNGVASGHPTLRDAVAYIINQQQNENHHVMEMQYTTEKQSKAIKSIATDVGNPETAIFLTEDD